MDSKSRLAISDLMLALTPGDGGAVVKGAQAALSDPSPPLVGACLCPIPDDDDHEVVLAPRFGATRARQIMAALRAGQSDGLVGDVAILRLVQDGTIAAGADRLLAFDSTALDRVLAQGWPSVVLTPAERRVLLATLAGLSLPMAAALEAALALPDAERAAMGARGRAWMARDFGWDGIASQMAQVYAWCLGQGDRPDTVQTA
jgi:hypothetical protein